MPLIVFGKKALERLVIDTYGEGTIAWGDGCLTLQTKGDSQEVGFRKSEEKKNEGNFQTKETKTNDQSNRSRARKKGRQLGRARRPR